MKKNYNVTGEQRKALAAKVEEITEEKKVYLGAPTMAYRVGVFTISKNGEITCEDGSEWALENLAEALSEAGFTAEEEPGSRPEEAAEAPTAPAQGEAEAEPEDTPEPGEKPTEAADEGPDSLSVSLPDNLTDEQFANLEKLVRSKRTLMAHAFRSEGITVAREDGNIVFSGFTPSDGEHTDAYLIFVTKLVKMAKEAQRVTGTDHEDSNEKFAFRVFLIRMGLVGKEFKTARKILLENLSGNAAFKTEEQAREFAEKQKRIREERKAAMAAETAEPAPETEGGDSDEIPE